MNVRDLSIKLFEDHTGRITRTMTQMIDRSGGRHYGRTREEKGSSYHPPSLSSSSSSSSSSSLASSVIITTSSSKIKRKQKSSKIKRKQKRSSCSTNLYVLLIVFGFMYLGITITIILQHNTIDKNNDNNKLVDNIIFSKTTRTIKSQSQSHHSNSNPNPNNYYDHPVGECAINLFGLPRSFKDYVLPSLIKNIIQINNRYQCDYYIHYFNITIEQSGAEAANNTSRGGNNGGIITPNDVLLLHDAVLQVSSSSSSSAAQSIKNGNIQQPEQIIKFVSDTDHDFEIERKTYINEIVYNNNVGSGDRGGSGSDDRVNQNLNKTNKTNPYHIHEKSFTDRTLINILKMWHSQDKVWNLMDANNNNNKNSKKTKKGKKQYNRVAMLRLDVIYTTPIDIYYVPYDPIPIDYNNDYLNGLRKIRGTQKKDIQYFYDYYNNSMNCVLPGFKSFPVNDRYFVGPYNATKIWAKDRFSRAKYHVLNVLPALQQQRQIEQQQMEQEEEEEKLGDKNDKDNNEEETTTTIMKMTDYGLHDEKFVAYTILPAIRRELQSQLQSQLKNTSSSTSIIQNNQNQIQNQDNFIHVDRELYFVRVRADGSIWLKDKPGYGRVKTTVLESVLNRSCAGSKPYEVYDEILGDKSPGKWQIKCPPLSSS